MLWMIAAGVIGDSALAEDIVQEAAIIAMGKLDQFQPGTDFTAWMGQIVRYVALNKSRTERRRRPTMMDPQAMEQMSAPAPAANDASNLRLSLRGELPPDQRHFDDRLVQALSSVSGVARACLLLRVLEGLSYAEISRLMEIPEGTAMSHVHRTCVALRQKLGDVTGPRGYVS